MRAAFSSRCLTPHLLTPARARRGFGALDASLAAGGDATSAYGALGAALDRFEAAVLSALDVTPAQLA